MVGLGAVVTGDIPACAVVAGNPARVIRYRDAERYKRLASEQKYLNRVRRKAPHRRRDLKKNGPRFKELMARRGFMLSLEVVSADPDWRSAILYEMARAAGVRFGNAERYHVAIRTDLLESPGLCCSEITRAVMAVDEAAVVNEEILHSDLQELHSALHNPEMLGDPLSLGSAH